MRDWNTLVHGKRVDPTERLNDTDVQSRAEPLLCDPNGILYVALAVDDTEIVAVNPNVDAKTAANLVGIAVSGVPWLYNGTTFDRQRNNTEETILASAARTATTNSADFTNYNSKGAQFIVDVTAIAATPSITVNIQGKDPVSSNYYTLLTSVAISTVSTTILKVYPGIGAVANSAASDILPRTFRVSVTHADADSITYSIGAALVV